MYTGWSGGNSCVYACVGVMIHIRWGVGDKNNVGNAAIRHKWAMCVIHVSVCVFVPVSYFGSYYFTSSRVSFLLLTDQSHTVTAVCYHSWMKLIFVVFLYLELSVGHCLSVEYWSSLLSVPGFFGLCHIVCLKSWMDWKAAGYVRSLTVTISGR